MNIFNERLKSLRISTNMTQNEFAKMFNITKRSLQYYESGDREPKLDKLIEIADYFDVSLDYLVGRSDNPKRF